MERLKLLTMLVLPEDTSGSLTCNQIHRVDVMDASPSIIDLKSLEQLRKGEYLTEHVNHPKSFSLYSVSGLFGIEE